LPPDPEQTSVRAPQTTPANKQAATQAQDLKWFAPSAQRKATLAPRSSASRIAIRGTRAATQPTTGTEPNRTQQCDRKTEPPGRMRAPVPVHQVTSRCSTRNLEQNATTKLWNTTKKTPHPSPPRATGEMEKTECVSNTTSLTPSCKAKTKRNKAKPAQNATQHQRQELKNKVNDAPNPAPT